MFLATATFFASIAIFLHGAHSRAWSVSPTNVSSAEELKMSTKMRLLAAAVGGVVLSGASSAHAQDAVQWRVEDGGNGHWYQTVVADPTSPNLAAFRATVIARGADLVSVASQGENDFVRDLGNIGNPTCRLVLGGFASGSPQQWHWTDGTPWTFSAWNPGEPNSAPIPVHIEMLVGTWTPHGKWIDAGDCCWENGCSRVAIEFSADCNTDGIVDYGQIRAGELVDTNANNIPDCCEQGFDCRFNAVQWRVEDGGNGHWYERIESWRTWDEAKNEAETVGGALVTINSQAEGAYLAQYVAPSLNFWAGGRRVQGAWQWITGEPWDYTAWNCNHCHPSCQPDYLWEDHLEAACFDGSTLRWNNYTSGNGRPAYVIEYSADCNSDGIVDYGQIRAGELVDANANNIPDCCEQAISCVPCAADIDESGAVNSVDLAAVLSNWGTNGGKYPRADIDGDGTVTSADLAAVLSAWGPCE
jgi:hypothetical protein